MSLATVETKNIKLKAVDFFCGAGGVTCGFNNAGIEVLGGIDIDDTCKETYEKNNSGSKFIHADISQYLPEDLEKELAIKKNDDDLIFVGCSPCQYYTIINTSREKSLKSRLLLEDFKHFIDYFKPGFILIENVPGLGSKIDSPLNSFKRYLTDNGYAFDDKIINAFKYNVPQSRKRYVLIATRLNTAISIPAPSEDETLTVRNALSVKNGFYPITAGSKDLSEFQHTSPSLSALNLQRLKLTPHNGGTRLSWKDNDELQLECYKNDDKLFYDVYGRMYWDLPSPTITTKFYSISNGRFAHPEQNRAISLREGATLQSFPMDYIFYSNSVGKIARMIGNAVPPNMAKHIGDAIIKSRIHATV